MWAQVSAMPEIERSTFAKHVITSSRSDRIAAMVKLAQSEPGIPVSPQELDHDPYLLNCPNGTVNLRTGELHEHRREDRITTITTAKFNPEAASNVWDQFLEAVFDGNGELIRFVQRFLGYALCGLIHEHVIAVLYGKGAQRQIDAARSLHARGGARLLHEGRHRPTARQTW